MFNRPWAFWRRVQYLALFLVLLTFICTGGYFAFFYSPADCFDDAKNGDERGIDCGGKCARVCAIDVVAPQVLWSQAFKVTNGQYNAVAYIENTNQNVGSPLVRYTFELYDRDGLITSKSGTTVLPPDSVYPIFEGRITTGDRIPTQTVITLEEPEVWVTATVGRDQFVIEGRELLNADTAPRLEAAITNSALTEAKDVEVVATIFDTRGNALTSSRTVVPRFGARETENVVFTWPEPIAKTIRSCEVPTDIIVAIDLSGSMNDDGGTPLEPISSVLAAAGAFIDRLGAKDQSSVVSYATNAQVRRELTSDKAVVKSTVASLMIDPKEEKGSTNIGDAFIAADAELGSLRHNGSARKIMVLLTDGLATAGGEDPETHATLAASELKNKETEVFTIGLGNKLNEAFLKEIATDENHYFKAPGVGTLDQIYRNVTEAICEDGAAIIEIVPKADVTFPGF